MKNQPNKLRAILKPEEVGAWYLWNSTQRDWVRNGCGRREAFSERQARYMENLSPELSAVHEM